MKRGIVPITLFAFVLSVAAVSAAYGQATTGELTGRVTDASGQVVAGATVTVAQRWRPAFTFDHHQRHRRLHHHAAAAGPLHA